MQKGIYISIKKEHLQRIVALEKNYEFRNYYPKNGADVLYVYESSPTCELKYIIELGEIIKYPDKITNEGYGNLEFNQGLKTKYAYEIKHLYALEKPISLKELRERYHFIPPQGYAYDITYKELTEKVKCSKVRKIT